jgi:DegV family protein with EDD domain
MRKTAIVTDSIATLPGEIAERQEIEIVPLQVHFGLEAFRDGVEISSAEFYRRLVVNETLPTTAAPLLGDLISAYKRAALRAESVVSIHPSGELSTTVDEARLAADQVDAPVYVLDSKSGAAAQGLIVTEAARAALAGAGPQEVLAAAHVAMERVKILIVFDTLEYLRKGGRIGAAQAMLASALSFKPIITLTNGLVKPVERPRTRRRARERVLALMRDDVKGRPVRAAVTQGDALTEAEAIRDQIADEFDCLELLLTEFTPVMGTHTGPGVLGIAYWCPE